MHASRVRPILDRFADGVPYEELARNFLDRERCWGDNPVLVLATAAASTTGQNYTTGVKPTVEQFREAFVETGRATTFTALADIPLEDDALVEAFGAQRKRHVLLESARVLADRPEASDLEAVEAWAAQADLYRYDEDPIGEISGVGPASFQYLRQLAGIDTVRPDPQVTQFVGLLAEEVDSPFLDSADPLRTVASCEWLAMVTPYRLLELDRLAWWTFAEEEEREEAMAALS